MDNNNNNSEEPNMKRRRTNDISISNAGNVCNNMQEAIGIDSFSNDIVIRFASYLCSRDLVNLSLTCRRFGSSKVDGLSLAETTARQIICNAKEDERNALPKLADQTYIEVYSELEQLRAPRIFDQLIGKEISYVDDDKSLVECSTQYTSSTAICDHVMRAGKHYVTFTIMEVSSMIHLGIVRPLPNWDQKGLDRFDPYSCNQNYSELRSERTDRWGHSNIHHCSLVSYGRYCWSDWERRYEVDHWDAREEASFGIDEEVGMLLDLEAGTLSIYKEGRRVCMLKDGLSGEYCWAVSLWEDGERVGIERGNIPN